ncbi:hypothetical protein Catovirus_1_875 [Catovirus CTV1]|uniref:Uncharacterized protein n=1 Tax=Catovirus CTV1 TaxID=1977631 RepID=A0A1V0SAS6_9VIRU|nr:hypothetical protein Catovirus_1_875 [Catovirus CTV1]
MNSFDAIDLSNIVTKYVPDSTDKLSFYHSDEINWVKMSIISIIAFAAYNLTVANLINIDHIPHHNLKLAINDIIKIGTIFVALRILLGEPLTDPEWIIELVYMLTGFLTYDFIVIELLNTDELKNNNRISKETKMAIDDILKFSTMFIVSRWLSGKKFTKEWISNVVGFIVGFVAYDYLVSEIL